MIICLQTNRVSYKLMGMARCVQSTQNNKFAISLQYFKKEVRNKYGFLHEDKTSEFFYRLVVSYLLVIARYAQSTQNSKFVISLQYLKKEGRDEVNFLHADKHQTILQVDVINFGGHGQACPNYSK